LNHCASESLALVSSQAMQPKSDIELPDHVKQEMIGIPGSLYNAASFASEFVPYHFSMNAMIVHFLFYDSPNLMLTPSYQFSKK
jgi:hypothetical protein